MAEHVANERRIGRKDGRSARSRSAGVSLVRREQNLLGETLQVLAGYPIIPTAFLRGSLVDQRPLPQMLVLHPDAITNTSEFWTALGSKLRPSLSVTVTIAVAPFQARPAET
jgi:hypothetical protein